MSWDGVERRRHERYTVTVRIPADLRIPGDIGEYLDGDEQTGAPPVPWTTAGTSIPYRRRRHGGDGTGQRIGRKRAGREGRT